MLKRRKLALIRVTKNVRKYDKFPFVIIGVDYVICKIY